MMKASMTGKRALVTGGSRGIGLEIATFLKECGAEVYVSGKSSNPSRKNYFSVDFEDPTSLKDFCRTVESLEIDVLVNNAGINAISDFQEIELDTFKKIQQVNLLAPLQLSQAVIPHMKAKNWGRIVNITSVFSIVSKEKRASYSASKFGLVGISSALAIEGAKYGILVNCVAPGFIDTDLTRKILGQSGIDALVQRVPIGRLGKSEEIAQFVGWLASPANTFLTGQNIAIDGGFTCA